MRYLVILFEVRVIDQDRFPVRFVSDGVVGSVDGRIGLGAFPDILSAFFEMFPLRTTSVSSSSHPLVGKQRLDFPPPGLAKPLGERVKQSDIILLRFLYLIVSASRGFINGP